jgi:hypothetical protein
VKNEEEKKKKKRKNKITLVPIELTSKRRLFPLFVEKSIPGKAENHPWP